jgi:hypothetical protein
MIPLQQFAALTHAGRTLASVCSLSGSLSATGSTATIVGTTRTWTVPVGNSGTITFNAVSTDGAGAVQYSKNGGAFTTITSGTNVTFANTDTLRMRTTSLNVGEGGTATLYDIDAAQDIGTYTWVRTS